MGRDDDGLAGDDGAVLLSAGLAAAPVEFLDFVLPLWAGAQIGATPLQVGALVAVEAGVSLLVRPFAGALADRTDRNGVGAAGAVVYALSFLAYAFAPGVGVALAAAALGGVGGALFWVALRARVGEGRTGQAAAYGRLLSAESQGAFFGFVVGFAALGEFGYRGLFLSGAAACAAAAVVLVPVGARPVPGGRAHVDGHGSAPDARTLLRRFWPLLVVVAATTTAEAGISLLLLLHLQREFGLSVGEIAAVFAPGFLLFILLPEHAHRIAGHVGRVRTLVASLVVSAVLALALALAPGPVVIAVLWALSAACLAAAIPVQESTVAEAARGSLGRAMGLYESAGLVGAVLGPVLVGALYGAGGWQAACLAASVALLAGAVCVPLAVQTLDLPARAVGPAPPRDAAPVPAAAVPAAAAAQDAAPAAATATTTSGAEHARKERENWFGHLVLFAVGQGIFFALGASWIAAALQGTIPDDVPGLMRISQVWTTVFIIDTIWSLSYSIFPKRDAAARSGSRTKRSAG